jgi:hypothetical protein
LSRELLDLPNTSVPCVRTRPPGAGRLEYKYFVPKSQVDGLRDALKPWVLHDEFCAVRPEKEYTVRSIYYDNRRFRCYDEKFDGFRLKKKLRIRGYNTEHPDNTVFLEIKRREEDFISKSRAPVRWSRIPEVFPGYGVGTSPLSFEPGAREAGGRFLYNYYRRRMLPVVLVAYEREAFHGRFDPMLRLTFDKNIRSRLYPELRSLYSDRDTKFLIPGYFIFEVKFYLALPRWIRDVVRALDLQRLAFSKFATGIEVHCMEQKYTRGVGHTVEFPNVVIQRGDAGPNGFATRGQLSDGHD